MADIENVVSVLTSIFQLCQPLLPEARSLLSGILNEDISNRGRAFLERSEQVVGMLQIMQNQYHFEREFDHMVSSLVDILSSYRQKVQRVNTDGQRGFECRRKYSGKPGRPAYSISYYQVEGFVSLGFTWKRIAELICVAERTLRRWRQEFVFDVSFSEIENEALDEIVAKQLQSCSSMGERILAGALRSQGLWIQRQRLRESTGCPRKFVPRLPEDYDKAAKGPHYAFTLCYSSDVQLEFATIPVNIR